MSSQNPHIYPFWTLDKKACSRVILANKLTRHDKLPQLFS